MARVHVSDQLGTFQSWLPLLGQYKYALNFACNGLAIIESIVMYGSLNYTNANNVLVSAVFSSWHINKFFLTKQAVIVREVRRTEKIKFHFLKMALTLLKPYTVLARSLQDHV